MNFFIILPKLISSFFILLLMIALFSDGVLPNVKQKIFVAVGIIISLIIALIGIWL